MEYIPHTLSDMVIQGVSGDALPLGQGLAFRSLLLPSFFSKVKIISILKLISKVPCLTLVALEQSQEFQVYSLSTTDLSQV